MREIVREEPGQGFRGREENSTLFHAGVLPILKNHMEPGIAQSSLPGAAGTSRKSPACGDRTEDHCSAIKGRKGFHSYMKEAKVNKGLI